MAEFREGERERNREEIGGAVIATRGARGVRLRLEGGGGSACFSWRGRATSDPANRIFRDGAWGPTRGRTEAASFSRDSRGVRVFFSALLIGWGTSPGIIEFMDSQNCRQARIADSTLVRIFGHLLHERVKNGCCKSIDPGCIGASDRNDRSWRVSCCKSLKPAMVNPIRCSLNRTEPN